MADDSMLTGYLAGQSDNRGYGGGMFGQDGWWVLILLVLFGWGNGGWGGYGNNGAGAGMQGSLTRSDLCQDMSFQEVKDGVRGVQQGLCDGFYAMNTGMLNGFAGVTNSLTTGFANLNTALCQQQFNTQQGFNNIATQIADCCCTTQRNIDSVNYNAAMNAAGIQKSISDSGFVTQSGLKDIATQSLMNTNAIQQSIQDCCCNSEKIAMQSRFDAAQYNCSTLQAIDKVGDRIIDYLAAEKTQTLRDQLQEARLAASQAAQTNAIVDRLSPCPVPAYPACVGGYYNANNFLGSFGGCNSGCGCGCNG